MDERMDGWTEGWTKREVYAWMHGWMDEKIVGCVNGWLDDLLDYDTRYIILPPIYRFTRHTVINE